MTILQDELMAIDGVADAHVEIIDDALPSVRLSILPDADRQFVGARVREVLANHGLRSRMAAGADEAWPLVEEIREAAIGEPPAPSAPTAIRRLDSIAVQEARNKIMVTASDSAGQTARVDAPLGQKSIRDAIVSAVFQLLGAQGVPPVVTAIRRTEEAGKLLVTVVLERAGGERLVGSSFVTVGWEFAFGRAIWSALTD